MVFNAVYDVQFTEEVTTEPLTDNEVKNWLRLSSDTDLELAKLTAKSARIILERFTNTSIIRRKVKATINNSLGDILLPYCPYVSGLVVKDSEGNTLTDVKTFGVEFVNLSSHNEDLLTVEYQAGYTSSNLPNVFKDALKQQLAYMWENRGDETVGIVNIAKQTLSPFKKVI